MLSWIRPERYAEFENLRRGIPPRFEDLGFKDTDFDTMLVPEGEEPSAGLFGAVVGIIDDVMLEVEEEIVLRNADPKAALNQGFFQARARARGGQDLTEISPKQQARIGTTEAVVVHLLMQSVQAYWHRIEGNKELSDYAFFDMIPHLQSADQLRRSGEETIRRVSGGKPGPT